MRKLLFYCDLITEKNKKTGYNKDTKKNTALRIKHRVNIQDMKKERMKIMSVVKVNQSNFAEVLNSSKTVLIDFYADWCGPCRMVSPIVDEIAAEHPEYLVCKINVDEEGELAAQFGVMSIPTLVVVKDGKVVQQSAGARPKAQILKLLEG